MHQFQLCVDLNMCVYNEVLLLALLLALLAGVHFGINGVVFVLDAGRRCNQGRVNNSAGFSNNSHWVSRLSLNS